MDPSPNNIMCVCVDWRSALLRIARCIGKSTLVRWSWIMMNGCERLSQSVVCMCAVSMIAGHRVAINAASLWTMNRNRKTLAHGHWIFALNSPNRSLSNMHSSICFCEWVCVCVRIAQRFQKKKIIEEWLDDIVSHLTMTHSCTARLWPAHSHPIQYEIVSASKSCKVCWVPPASQCAIYLCLVCTACPFANRTPCIVFCIRRYWCPYICIPTACMPPGHWNDPTIHVFVTDFDV